MFVDTHLHLDDEILYKKLDSVIQEARQANVGTMIVSGSDINSCIRTLEISDKFDDIYATIGFHPTEIQGYGKKEYDWLENMGRNDHVVAIGECGYDFYWTTTVKEEQTVAFIKQIEIAKRIGKPLVIHARNSMQETYELLVSMDAKKVGGVIHSFNGSLEMANLFINEGFYISVAGPITFPKSIDLRMVVENTDSNFLLSETDAPYLTPHPHRRNENYPKYLPLIVAKMAEIRNINITEMAEIINCNTETLFKIKVI